MLRGRFLRTSTFRLTLAYVGLFGVSVLLVLGFITWSTAQSISRQVDDAISAEIDALTQRHRLGGLEALIERINDRIGPRNVNGGLYLLTDAAHRPLAGNIAAWPSAVDAQGRWLTFPLGDAEAARGRARAAELEGGHRLLVGRDTRAVDHFQTLMVEAMAWALAGTLLLGGGGGYVLSRRTLGRIDDITRGAERIMHGDMGHRIPRAGSGDEYDRLVDTLNAMLDQIAALMDGVRRVADTVAHDLRSPLTRLRGDLERAVLAGGSAEDLRAACEAAMADADGLLATFRALLSIAEAESGVGLAEAHPVDAAALIADVVDLYGPVAEDAGLTLETPAPPPPTLVLGNRELLFQALTNLVDNALKYTPPPGRIAIGLEAGPAGSVDLVVADSGPGIPQADRARVLDRFVRLDAARTTPGNGLGLSLVAAIARKHRAALLLEDAAPGLRVRMRLPGA